MPFAKNTFELLKWLSGFTIWQNQEIGMVVKYKLAVGETQKWYMYTIGFLIYRQGEWQEFNIGIDNIQYIFFRKDFPSLEIFAFDMSTVDIL